MPKHANGQRNGQDNELPGDEQYWQEWSGLLAVGAVLWRGIRYGWLND